MVHFNFFTRKAGLEASLKRLATKTPTVPAVASPQAVSCLTLPPYTLHPAPYTLHPTPYTLHPTPYNLHPTPYPLHLTPYHLNPKS